MNILKTRKSFKKEFKRQLRLAITAAIGFTVAYAWRNAIYDSMYRIIDSWADTNSATLAGIYTAIFATFLGVCLIFLTARMLRE